MCVKSIISSINASQHFMIQFADGLVRRTFSAISAKKKKKHSDAIIKLFRANNRTVVIDCRRPVAHCPVIRSVRYALCVALASTQTHLQEISSNPRIRHKGDNGSPNTTANTGMLSLTIISANIAFYFDSALRQKPINGFIAQSAWKRFCSSGM